MHIEGSHAALLFFYASRSSLPGFSIRAGSDLLLAFQLSGDLFFGRECRDGLLIDPPSAMFPEPAPSLQFPIIPSLFTGPISSKSKAPDCFYPSIPLYTANFYLLWNFGKYCFSYTYALISGRIVCPGCYGAAVLSLRRHFSPYGERLFRLWRFSFHNGNGCSVRGAFLPTRGMVVPFGELFFP